MDDVLRPIHGGPDGGPEPLYDFSTNANALGPNPVVLEHIQAKTLALRLLPRSSIAFLCLPNNPTGEVYPFLEEAVRRAGGALVLDLAYFPLMETPPSLPQGAWLLYSPNKAHGLTGVRAGYLVAPLDLTVFQNLAPSWPVSVYGEGLLERQLDPRAQAWLESTRKELHRLRGLLAQGLRELGLEVRESPANFLLVRVGRATEVARALREKGIRVRDATSFGLPEWLRLSAGREEAIGALLEALAQVLAKTKGVSR